MKEAHQYLKSELLANGYSVFPERLVKLEDRPLNLSLASSCWTTRKTITWAL